MAIIWFNLIVIYWQKDEVLRRGVQLAFYTPSVCAPILIFHIELLKLHHGNLLDIIFVELGWGVDNGLKWSYDNYQLAIKW